MKYDAYYETYETRFNIGEGRAVRSSSIPTDKNTNQKKILFSQGSQQKTKTNEGTKTMMINRENHTQVLASLFRAKRSGLLNHSDAFGSPSLLKGRDIKLEDIDRQVHLT